MIQGNNTEHGPPGATGPGESSRCVCVIADCGQCSGGVQHIDGDDFFSITTVVPNVCCTADQMTHSSFRDRSIVSKCLYISVVDKYNNNK